MQGMLIRDLLCGKRDLLTANNTQLTMNTAAIGMHGMLYYSTDNEHRSDRDGGGKQGQPRAKPYTLNPKPAKLETLNRSDRDARGEHVLLRLKP